MPFTPPPTFMNHMLAHERRFATATFALSDVKETGKALGVTINDMVLALSAGALRKLRLRYDGDSDHPLLASVPVSFDFSPDHVSGNLFTRIMVALPADVDDPLERVRRSHDYAVDAKESHQLLGPELVSRWAAYFPPGPSESLFRWLASRDGQNKVLNLPISNVPGPREHGRVGGALVTEIYSVGPLTTGSGLNITVWSYVDQLNVSVLADGATVDDPHEVTEAVMDELIEIRRAAGLSDKLTVLSTRWLRPDRCSSSSVTSSYRHSRRRPTCPPLSDSLPPVAVRRAESTPPVASCQYARDGIRCLMCRMPATTDWWPGLLVPAWAGALRWGPALVMASG